MGTESKEESPESRILYSYRISDYEKLKLIT